VELIFKSTYKIEIPAGADKLEIFQITFAGSQ